MTCETCAHQDKPRTQLADGREVCTWCEDWRHETEARHILNLPTLSERRAYLYGRLDRWGKLSGGVDKKRGPEALARLEATMIALWKKRNADAKAQVMNRTPGSR